MALLLVSATFVALLATAATASAASYFVEEGAVGDCSAGDPCGTIAAALAAHRADPQPDDVIEVAEGTYPETVDATDPDDAGLTIRGELDGGEPVTEISGDGPGAAICGDCIVALGLDVGPPPDDVEVTLENVFVNQFDADLDLTPISIEGGSDLDTVDVDVIDADTFAAVELCDDPGTVIDDSFVDATGTDAAGISGCAGATVRDTGIFTTGAPAIEQFGSPDRPSSIIRSWLSVPEDGTFPAADLSSDATVDSSLVTGGEAGLAYVGDEDASWVVNNSTVDAGVAGEEDPPPVASVVLTPISPGLMDVDFDSSILVDELVGEPSGGTATVACDHTDLPATDLASPEFTDQCPLAGAPGSTNTSTDPDDLFVGFSFFGDYDWDLRAGSPAIDRGRPGPVPPGMSATDFLGDPRLMPGTAATCPTGIRDQGAYERAAVSCRRTLAVSTTGTGAGTVTGPGIACGAGQTDCSETVAIGTSIELTATAGGGSSFDGFSGGGCSSSPCTVTLSENRSVQAAFSNSRAGRRTLTVSATGRGSGTITGPGIDCGGEGHTDCSESYPLGERVELSAEPTDGSLFNRFTGSGCEADPCVVTMDGSRGVVGRFVEARAPRTSFAKKPRRPWRRNPVFRMRSSEPASTFECRLDGGEWEECGRRVRLRGLDPGRHRFKARAINRRGVVSPQPAKARFRVPRR